jgi:hypothetical protein
MNILQMIKGFSLRDKSFTWEKRREKSEKQLLQKLVVDVNAIRKCETYFLEAD